MSDTAIRTSKPSPPLPPPVPEKVTRPKPSLAYRALTAIASLRLTVTLFALSVFLIFCGTVAMVDSGIWTVVNHYFRWYYVWIPFQVFVKFGQVFFGFSPTLRVSGSFLYPGGWLLGGLLLLNLLAAHAIRFKLSWKRSGILILHSGVVILMLGELITGLFAVESTMTLEDGETVRFVDVSHESELAIIHSLDGKTDEVVAIPEPLLRKGGVIRHEALPFDLVVDRWMVNSDLVKAEAGKPNPATAGDGLNLVAKELPEVSGADPEGRMDMASAYVTFRAKDSDRSLGTYLVSMFFYSNFVRRQLPDQPQHVVVGDKTYDVILRFKREYKPYSIHLNEFQHKVYEGTTTPKDFSSFVRLTDATRNEDRESHIYMNSPLRYAGETFYQSSFLNGDKGTVLQVVRNPGWLLPYVSCALVAVGMLIHFLILLIRFLSADLGLKEDKSNPIVSHFRKLRSLGIPVFLAIFLMVVRPIAVLVSLVLARARAVRRAAGDAKLSPAARVFPWGVLALAAVYLFISMWPPETPKDQIELQGFGRLPVISNGRVKPLDTVARTSLMFVSHRQEFVDESDKTQPAIKWLLDVMTSQLSKTGAAENYQVFRIENDQVLSLLGLKPRKGLRYAVNELAAKIDALEKQANEAQKRPEKERDTFDVKVIELAKQLQVYIDLAHLQSPHMVPPVSEQEEWQPFPQAFREMQATGKENPAFVNLTAMLAAYSKNKAEDFNKELANYDRFLETNMPDKVRKADFEVWFNNFEPFYQCMIFYVVVFVLTCLSFLIWRQPLRQAAFWLALLTLGIHTLALITRMYLQGRPPVTNLYSSAVFIGWACVILGLLVEVLFRLGIGNLLASALGFVAVLISHHLAGGSDTLEMMQAVLDTNFWLATHVTCVTLGYAATFAAGGVATLYVFLGAATPWLKKDLHKALAQIIYGIVCFATLLSFTGTVLGGIWADQSWGRFWGWDPKENGALLIVVWNALILHARWAGLVKPRGVAILAIVGNMITAWSWFGTNQLGVGLHAYGFNNSLARWLVMYWASQIGVLAVGLLPPRYWNSYRTWRARGSGREFVG